MFKLVIGIAEIASCLSAFPSTLNFGRNNVDKEDVFVEIDAAAFDQFSDISNSNVDDVSGAGLFGIVWRAVKYIFTPSPAY